MIAATESPSRAVPEMVKRYRCPHCLKLWASQSHANSHVPVCFRNPAARSCVTCVHHAEFKPANCTGPELPERCRAEWDSTPVFIDRRGEPQAGPELSFPQLNCPMWDPGGYLGAYFGHDEDRDERYTDADFPLMGGAA